MENKQYFGGTDLTIDKLIEVYPTINVDGTTYKIENWLKECEVFDKLIPNKSTVWIPYNEWRTSTNFEVVWDKEFFSNSNPDWFVYEPYLVVENNWYVYEISFYKKWKRKTQMNHLIEQNQKPKRKFLSKKDISDIIKQEHINNRNEKNRTKM